MFVGHYGVAFGAKPSTPAVPLWVYFIAVQWLDVVWSVLVLLGVEKLHIVPGFTEANPYDLYYMPYTHGLPGEIRFPLEIAVLLIGTWYFARRLPPADQRGHWALHIFTIALIALQANAN